MKNIDDALKIALTMEKKGYDLYMQASKKTENKLGKATLESIAKKELDHIRAIEDFSEKHLNKALEDIHPLDKKDYIKPIMEQLGSELDKNITKDTDLEKAYQAALKLEKAAYDFYKTLSEKSDDHLTKKFFEFLMNEENMHYELFNETLEYLNHPGNWYREQERWIVEG